VERAHENLDSDQSDTVVADVLGSTSLLDVHTHLFSPEFGDLGLWGIDDLLTYHYLEAELFRFAPIRPEQYWKLSKTQRADLIWRTLFVENTPLSEATRGVVAVLQALGIESQIGSLERIRDYFRQQQLPDHISRVFRLAGIESVVMTNDPLDHMEAAIWKRGVQPDRRFQAALRLDRILNEWPAHYDQIAASGYAVQRDGGGRTPGELRRFLMEWSARMQPVYLAVSLPDSFQFPADDLRSKLLTSAILPCCRELGVPLALMIGVRRQVNPALRLAGDGSGRADLRALEALCRDCPDNRFLVSVLSRENQHELCVCARKFQNLMPFGCWWFLNNPSIVEEITRERLEMLGVSFIPQHSDARILEQLLYKWRNTRRTLAPVLAQRYRLLIKDGWTITREDISRDVTRLFRRNFEQWTNLDARYSRSGVAS
jgi:hypothetical protein